MQLPYYQHLMTPLIHTSYLQILRGLEQGISGGGGVPPMLVGMARIQKLLGH